MVKSIILLQISTSSDEKQTKSKRNISFSCISTTTSLQLEESIETNHPVFFFWKGVTNKLLWSALVRGENLESTTFTDKDEICVVRHKSHWAKLVCIHNLKGFGFVFFVCLFVYISKWSIHHVKCPFVPEPCSLQVAVCGAGRGGQRGWWGKFLSPPQALASIYIGNEWPVLRHMHAPCSSCRSVWTFNLFCILT